MMDVDYENKNFEIDIKMLEKNHYNHPKNVEISSRNDCIGLIEKLFNLQYYNPSFISFNLIHIYFESPIQFK
jgi:hypothetical protein